MTKNFRTPKAFEELFKVYFNPLVNFVYQYIKDWESSREIVQDTFLKIWKNRKILDIHTSLNSYLYQTARNTMIDYIRKNQNIQNKLEGYKIDFENARDDGPSLNSFVIKQAILQAMKKLKPKNKEIFKLNKFEGLTYKEIASHLNISERSVEDNISRAMKILKEELKDHPDLF